MPLPFTRVVFVQIGVSAGAECKAALQETTQLVEQRLASNGKALKKLFNAGEVWFSFLALVHWYVPETYVKCKSNEETLTAYYGF